MYKDLIKNYINKLKKEDIIKYIEKNNYQLDNKEIDTIYFYIKNYYQDFLDNNQEIWDKLKKDVSEKTYLEIIKLYSKYKKYIN